MELLKPVLGLLAFVFYLIFPESLEVKPAVAAKFEAQMELFSGASEIDVERLLSFLWGEKRKVQLLASYPLSEVGEEILANRTSIVFMPNQPGYAGAPLDPNRERATLLLGTPDLGTVFHEFSHGALNILIDRKLYPEIVMEIQKEIADPTPGYESLMGCYMANFSPPGPDDQDFQDLVDQHHYIQVLAEVAGGNLNLIPPRLRKYYPWLSTAEPQSWLQVQHLYFFSDLEARRLIRLVFANQSPVFCWPGDPPPGEEGLENLPGWVWERVQVFREAERNLLLDFLQNWEEIAHFRNDDPSFWGRYREELIFAAELNPDLKSSLMETLRRIESRFQHGR